MEKIVKTFVIDLNEEQYRAVKIKTLQESTTIGEVVGKALKAFVSEPPKKSSTK